MFEEVPLMDKYWIGSKHDKKMQKKLTLILKEKKNLQKLQ